MGATQSASGGCDNGECTGNTFIDRCVSGWETAGLTCCIAVGFTRGGMIHKVCGQEGCSSVRGIGKFGATRAMSASNKYHEYADLLVCALVKASCRRVNLLLSRWGTSTTFL